MSLGENIRSLREAAGYTQEQLATLLGVGRTTITLWEKNDRIPKMANVKRLAEVFHVPMDHVLGNLVNAAVPVSSGLTVEVPLYGSISAGQPAEMVEVEEMHPIPLEVERMHPGAYLLKVKGESMNRVLPNGSYALVDPCDDVDVDGKAYVVALDGDEATVKRVRRLGNGLELMPDSYDPTYKARILDFGEPTCPPVSILGRVVWFTMPYGWTI